MRKVVIGEGDEVCSRCKGHGNEVEEEEDGFTVNSCSKCHGKGKLDWVTNAMGTPPAQPNPTYYGTFAMINPEPNRIHTSDGKLVIGGDLLEIEAKTIKITDEALESLTDSIERKLKERENDAARFKFNP